MARQENASYENGNNRQPIKVRELEEALNKAQNKLANLQKVVNNLQEKLLECWMLGNDGIEIPESADLKTDDYKVPGNYYCPTNDRAETLSNCPISKYAFTLKVYYGTGTSNYYIIQEYITFFSGQRYYQVWDGYSDSWNGPYCNALSGAGFTPEFTDVKTSRYGSFSGLYNSLIDLNATLTNCNKVITNLGTQVSGSQLTTTVTNSWTNNASITIHEGTWIVEGEISYTGIAGKSLTVKMLYGSSEIGRQSVMSSDTNIYSAHLTSVITVSSSTTVYLQTWSSGITALNNGVKMKATRLK